MKPEDLTLYTGTIQGRLASIPSTQLAAYPDKVLDANIERYDGAANAERIEPKLYGHLLDVRGKNPAHGVASGRQVAALLAEDFAHFKDVKAAAGDGNLVSVAAGPNGERQFGVVTMDDPQAPKRTGLWTTVNKDGVRVAQGTYLDGEKHGVHREFYPDGRNVQASSYWDQGVQQKSSFKYNEKSEPIEKATWKDGEQLTVEAIDPVVQAAKRAEQKAAQSAMHSVKF